MDQTQVKSEWTNKVNYYLPFSQAPIPIFKVSNIYLFNKEILLWDNCDSPILLTNLI